MPSWRYICICLVKPTQSVKYTIGCVGSSFVCTAYCVSHAEKIVQLDTIIYPRSAKTHSLVRIPWKVKGWISRSTSKQRTFPEFKVPHRSLLLTECLEIHLRTFRKVLIEGHVAEEHGIAKIASQIINVLDLFMSRYIILNKSRCPVPWQDNAVRKVC